jgi:hypothetical protein
MKFCKYCLTELEQREDESDQNWQDRKYCNKTCSSKHRQEKKRGK